MLSVVGVLPERRLVAKPVVLRRLRRLDVEGGRVVVAEGEVVRAADIVARGRRSQPPAAVPVARLLGVAAAAVPRCLVKRPGELVQADEVIARRRGLLGLGARACQAPRAGALESGPAGSGEVLIVPPPEDVELRAHLPGTVVSVLPGEGVVIELPAVGVQGIVGCGGEDGGRLVVLGRAGDPIPAGRIAAEHAGAVLLGGSVDVAALRRAVAVGARGVVVGSLRLTAFEAFAAERHALPLVVTDSFGVEGMSERCFGALQRLEGREARVSGGAPDEPERPPEVILPSAASGAPRIRPAVLEVGAGVRIAGGPHSLAVGTVRAVGARPARLPSGLAAAWVDVDLDDGAVVRVPVANLELLGT